LKAPVPCGIRDIDLGEPLSDVAAEGDERSVCVVFWKDGVPVGRRLFLEGELPVRASALPALAARTCAPALAHRHRRPPGYEGANGLAPSDVSVVVCTCDRHDDLRRCIAAIEACDPQPREIIVVDNSTGPGVVGDMLAGHPRVRVVRETRRGLSRARNTGLATATGAVVAFTDDDVEVTPNWIACLAAAFADPGVGAVTGPVLPARLRTEAEFAFEFDLGGLGASLEPRDFDRTFLDTGALLAPAVWEMGAGANFALRTAVLKDTGPFDERLGAGAAGCSEDSEFLYRVLGAGWTCLYRPEVVVRHHHRADEAALRRQQRAYARGHVAALLVQYGESRHFGNLKRALFDLPRYYVYWFCIRLAHLAGFRWLDTWGPVSRATRVPQVLGWVAGLSYLLRHARAPKYDVGIGEAKK
jgi:GT2 family glycosyltransferase